MSEKEELVTEITFLITHTGKIDNSLFKKAANLMYKGLPKRYARNMVGTGRTITQAEFEKELEEL